jgi:hypothetical protein
MSPSPIDCLIERAGARAMMWQLGMLELQQAVDVLQQFAVDSGLVDCIGQDRVTEIIGSAFEQYRDSHD